MPGSFFQAGVTFVLSTGVTAFFLLFKGSIDVEALAVCYCVVCPHELHTYFQKDTFPALYLRSYYILWSVCLRYMPWFPALSDTIPHRVPHTYRSTVFRLLVHKPDLARRPLVLQPVVRGLQQAIAAKNLWEHRQAFQCCSARRSIWTSGFLLRNL